MWERFSKRTVSSIVMLLVASFVIYIIIVELPVDGFIDRKLRDLQARGDRSAELRIQEYRARYGLDSGKINFF
ncbi:MAG: hypothetical protein K8R89_05300, partial [Anaerolineae bacterium]|nr:hypothetical protein [Anaerolineae bacterium]